MSGMQQAVEPVINFDQFQAVDIRVGRIVAVEAFPQARKPAWKLTIDFGAEIGTKRSSAQLVARYSEQDLLGRLVMAVVNFPPRQIGPFMSEVLTLGVPDSEGAVILLTPDQAVPLGGRMF
jgi:tRNA-binding protein